MTPAEFKASLAQDAPPEGLAQALEALWQDGKGDWHAAHKLTQGLDDATGTRIHAYLHRKEGDLSNARYWYARADEKMPETPLEQEWERLVEGLL